jgi:hypothetical protein
MAIIASTLATIKSAPLALLGGAARVNECFAGVGYTWRPRLLDPARTMKMFILQVLHGNTAISHLRQLSEEGAADSSYCAARARLPVAGIAAAVDLLCGNDIGNNQRTRQWLGRRVLIADATSALMPDASALQQLWPQHSSQKPGCGFPVVKLLGLMDVVTGMILHVTMMAMNVHEYSQMAGAHAVLRCRDVLLADRGFCSFAHLAMLAAVSVDAVFRMHQRQIVNFTPGRAHRGKAAKKYKRGVPASRFVRSLGKEDQVVEWVAPVNQPSWMTDAQFAALPGTIRVRELRYRITAKGRRTRWVTIAATLLDPIAYPKDEIAKLYGLRWEIETNFRHLKTTMGMEHLKCQSPEGVMKELMVFVLVYNMVRGVMVPAAARQGIADANRMSFVDALRWLRSQAVKVPTGILLELIINAKRPGRWCPRVKKRRMKPYDLMNKPRAKYTEPVENEGVEA